MALSDILETIRSEAEDTVSAILAAAEAEADRITARAEEEAAAEEQRLSTSLDDRARLERSRIMSRAHLEVARERRAAREGVFKEALDRAVTKITKLRTTTEYEDVMASLLDEALAVLPEPSVARVDSADVELMQRVLSARDLVLEIEVQEVPLGGVAIVADRRSVDNRFISRIHRADRHLRYLAGEMIPDLRGITT